MVQEVLGFVGRMMKEFSSREGAHATARATERCVLACGVTWPEETALFLSKAEDVREAVTALGED